MKTAFEFAVLIAFALAFNLLGAPAWAQPPEIEEAVAEAEAHLERGDYEEAESPARDALKLTSEYFGDNHPNTVARLNLLADVLSWQDRPGKARAYRKRAEQLARALYQKYLNGHHPPETLVTLAEQLYQREYYDWAENIYQRAVGAYEVELGQDHPERAVALLGLARAQQHIGFIENAEENFRLALTLVEQGADTDEKTLAEALEHLGRFSYQQGRYAEAERLYRRSVAILEKQVDEPDVSKLLFRSLQGLATSYYGQDRYDDAVGIFERSIEVAEQAFDEDHPFFGIALFSLASAVLSQERYAEAEDLRRRALAILEDALNPRDSRVWTARIVLGNFYADQSRYAEADQLFDRVLETDKRTYGSDPS